MQQAKTRPGLDPLADLARRAGAEVMAVYNGPMTVSHKADRSPVTEADVRAEAVILRGLAALSPGVPVVAEEQVAAGQAPQIDPAQPFWLVDPLDGTREFIQRNGQFTVNIALIAQGEPVLGVVYAPALDRLFAGEVGSGAWEESAGQRRKISGRAVPPEGLAVLASRSHGDEAALQAFLAPYPVAGITGAGSSLKLCLLAAGEADLYPRLGRTMAWDIAAGHAVVAAAGGLVLGLDGRPMGYALPGFENPHFVAWGRAPMAGQWPQGGPARA